MSPVRFSLVGRFADSPPSRSDDVARYQADLRHDGQVFVTEQVLDGIGGRAVIGIAAQPCIAQRWTRIVPSSRNGSTFEAPLTAMAKSYMDEAITGGLTHLGI